MAITKYSPVGFPNPRPWAYRALRDAPRGAHAGREAPLVLIKEHLTEYIEFPEVAYKLAWVAGEERPGWNVPIDGVSLGCNEFGENFVAKLQPFKAGGWELTCRSLDLQKIGATMEGRRRFGKRERPESVDRENILKAAQRAKRKVRYLTKNMGASHLVTFNRQEGPNTRNWRASDWENWRNGGREAWEAEHGPFWSPEDWGKAWDKLRRMIVRVKGEFPYVAVLEHHKKGNYHLHVAWVEAPGQKVNLNLVRGCWWAVVGGRGCGNVDAQYIKVRAGLERADRVAKYISKYTTKHFEEDGRFNKKRYWASRQDMEAVRRYVLNVHTQSDALAAVQAMHGLNMSDYMKLGDKGIQWDGFFPFPDGSGFWLTYIPEKHGGAPPPF